jgi:hypothetical protein
LLNPTWAYFFKPVGRRQVKAGTRPKKAARLPAKKAARKTARSTVKRKTARKAK